MNNDEKIVFLTKEEKKKLFKCLDKSNYKNVLRDKAIIKLSLYCALKASEVGSVQIKDFNKQERKIYCTRNQKGKSVWIKIIDDDVYDSLCEYYEERQNVQYSSPYLFLSQIGKPISRSMLHTMMKGYCEEADIDAEKRHFNVLRHTRGIELLNMGLTLQEVQWWLGHINIKNTAVYLQYMNRNIDENEIYTKVKRGLTNAKKKDKQQGENKPDS